MKFNIIKYFKILIPAIGGIVILLLLLAALLPSQAQISRTIQIKAKSITVYTFVADFNNFKKWNPWSQKEPDAENKLTGTPLQPGHTWYWKGEEIGEGSLTLEKLEPGKRIESRLEFLAPMQTVAKDIWILNETDGVTEVEWIYEAYLKFPVERFFGLFLDDMIGKEFDQGLNNLKNLLESNVDR